MKWLDNLPWLIVIVSVVTLGMAPYAPEPHVVQKLLMLADGVLSKPIDIGDLFLHLTPWLLLIMKSIQQIRRSV